ncbi:uncharacterized protein RBU57_003916 [Macrochelys suwanniensis]
MEKTRAEQNLPDNTNNPSPITHKWERLCPPYDESRDIAEYFLTFERLCNLHTIPDAHKMTILVAKLTGSALDIFNDMPLDEASDYEKFKDLVLKQFQVTPETYRVKFRTLIRGPGLSNVAYVNRIKELLKKWVKGRNVTSFEGVCDLMAQEQFLNMSKDDIRQCLWDKKMDSADSLAAYADQYEQSQISRGARKFGTQGVQEAERNNPGHSLGRYQKGKPETTPPHQEQPKAPQGKTQTPYCPTTPFSSNPPRPTDQSAGRCFKCNELGHVKANCPKNPNRIQFITPGSLHRGHTKGPQAQMPPRYPWSEGKR